MVDLNLGGIGVGDRVVTGVPVPGDHLAAGWIDLCGCEGVALQDLVTRVAAVAVAIGRVAEPVPVVAVLVLVGDGDEREDVERRHANRARSLAAAVTGTVVVAADVVVVELVVIVVELVVGVVELVVVVDGAVVEVGVDPTVSSVVLESTGVAVDEAVIDSLLSGLFADGGADAGERDERCAAVGGPALPPGAALEASPHAWALRSGHR